MRLDKVLSATGFGSRKDVKKIIRKGYVTVNDEVIKNDDFHVDPNIDEIYVDDIKVEYKEFVYIMLNKPKGYVSANRDKYYPPVTDLVYEYEHLDISCVGRLDLDTTGLLLITNDGNLSHNLLSPKKHVSKIYEVIVDNKILDEHIEIFKNGVIIEDGYECLPANLTILESNSEQSKALIEIYEGKFHQVKRMFQAIGMEVVELKRLQMKNLVLDPELELGEYRLLTEEELLDLKN